MPALSNIGGALCSTPQSLADAHYQQGCKRDLSLRDRDIRFLVRDETETKTFLQFRETETSDFCHKTRPRPCKAETETFFETFNLQHYAKTVNGDVQVKTIYIKQYRYLVFYSV